MDKFLRDLIKRKKAELKKLEERSNASTDLAEVRAIGENIDSIKEEIRSAEAELDKIEKIENEDGIEGDDGTEGRSGIPEGTELRNGVVVGTFGIGKNSKRSEDDENIEYRKAFMEYVMRGTPIPAELRADASTTTSDAGNAIPTMLVNQIVEKFDHVGMILPLITKTSYAAGIEIPTSSLKPVASWVSEGAGSDKQKKTTAKITFSYFKLRCEISMSMEVGTMALSAFEAKFVENVTKAMVYAIEEAIVNGTGTGQPKGILTETAPTTVTIVDGVVTYKTLCDMEAAIPEEYEATAKWCMSKKTFMHCMSITDDAGQPVARVNYGVEGKIERTILGREVVMASKYMPNIDAETAETVAFAFDFAEYVLNTIYDMGISKKQDWDTEDLLTKAVMSADGKVISTDSLVKVDNTLGA